MHLDRLMTGQKVAGASAIVLVGSTFLDWFVVSVPESRGVDFFVNGAGQSAWNALEYIPIVLTITAFAALVVAVLRLAGVTGELPVPANSVVAVLGTLSVLLILFRIIDPPSFGSLQGFFGRSTEAELTVEFGIFVGLLAAAGIAFGGYWASREEGTPSSSPRAGKHRDQAKLHIRGKA